MTTYHDRVDVTVALAVEPGLYGALHFDACQADEQEQITTSVEINLHRDEVAALVGQLQSWLRRTEENK